MSPITIPYHLVIPFVVGLIILSLIVVSRKNFLNKKYHKSIWISLIGFFSIYILFVGIALYEDLLVQYEVNKYDLNKDGFFSAKEAKMEGFNEAMNGLVHDVGRNFSIFTSAIFAFIVSFSILLIGLLFETFSNRLD